MHPLMLDGSFPRAQMLRYSPPEDEIAPRFSGLTDTVKRNTVSNLMAVQGP